MKQGTVSVLIGCHSVIHSYFVWWAWVKLYHNLPNFREAVCILLHDIGHWGTNYLDNEKEKADHWKLGAKIAFRLFGRRGYLLVAGHTRASGFPSSMILLADKHSWLFAPDWWLKLNYLVEPKINAGIPINIAVKRFRAAVKANVESDYPVDTHSIYLDWKKESK